LYINSNFSVFFLRFSKKYCSQIEVSGKQHSTIIMTILCDIRLVQGVKSQKLTNFQSLNITEGYASLTASSADHPIGVMIPEAV